MLQLVRFVCNFLQLKFFLFWEEISPKFKRVSVLFSLVINKNIQGLP